MYAEGTSVPVEKSKAEIERMLQRYGASAFGSFWEGARAIIMFEANKRRVRFALDMPKPEEFRMTTGERARKRNDGDMARAHDQEIRRRWRSLALVIKAKLEAVETGVSEFESEFLSHIVMPDGKTVGETLIPQIATAYETKKMPPMLTGGK